MNRLFSVSVMSAALGALSVLCGCDSSPTLYSGTGTVLYDGKPLPADAQAVVTFAPTVAAPASTASVQPDGTFELESALSGDSGVVAGEHNVSISIQFGTPTSEGGMEKVSSTPPAEFRDKATVTEGENEFNFSVPIAR